MDRRFLCSLVCFALVFSLFYLAAPVTGGLEKAIEKPIKIVLEKTGLDKSLNKIGGDVLKKGNVIVGNLFGKFEKIHKNVEKGVFWLKQHKGEISGSLGGLITGVLYDEKTRVVTIIKNDNNKDYFAEFIPDNENNRYNIYVNDEICGVLHYKHLENCSEKQIAERFKIAGWIAIRVYKESHR